MAASALDGCAAAASSSETVSTISWRPWVVYWCEAVGGRSQRPVAWIDARTCCQTGPPEASSTAGARSRAALTPRSRA